MASYLDYDPILPAASLLYLGISPVLPDALRVTPAREALIFPEASSAQQMAG